MDPTEQQQQKSTILRIRLKLSQNAAEIQRNKVVISTQKKNRYFVTQFDQQRIIFVTNT
jgi:hypothetical protein